MRKGKTSKLIVIALVLFIMCPSFLVFGEDTREETRSDYQIGDNDANIMVYVDEEGYFSVGTADGRKLTFSFPSAWRGTYISIEIDGTVYDCGDRNGVSMDDYLQGSEQLSDTKGKTTWDINGIILEQIMTVHPVPGHLYEGYVTIELKVANDNLYSSDVRVRYYFDTQVDSNDGAPFYVPNYGLVTNETEYTNSNINFNYIQDFDDYEDPTLIGRFSLDDNIKPYKIILAEWENSVGHAWDYSIGPSTDLTHDSAALFYYDLGTIFGGGSASSILSYGLGSMGSSSEDYAFKVDQVNPERSTYVVNEDISFDVDIGNSYPYNQNGDIEVSLYEPSSDVHI